MVFPHMGFLHSLTSRRISQDHPVASARDDIHHKARFAPPLQGRSAMADRRALLHVALATGA
jgi:hypothetical protein